MKIYVASSWRSPNQPAVIESLRRAGHEVYDFRNPANGNHGFHWSEIDLNWRRWTSKQFRDSLQHPLAINEFKYDKDALDWCEICVLLLPCGRSAHLEAGYIIGQRKPVFILLADADGEPELMYKMATDVITTMRELIERLETT